MAQRRSYLLTSSSTLREIVTAVSSTPVARVVVPSCVLSHCQRVRRSPQLSALARSFLRVDLGRPRPEIVDSAVSHAHIARGQRTISNIRGQRFATGTGCSLGIIKKRARQSACTCATYRTIFSLQTAPSLLCCVDETRRSTGDREEVVVTL